MSAAGRLAALTLLVAGCGGSDGDAGEPAAEATTTTARTSRPATSAQAASSATATSGSVASSAEISVPSGPRCLVRLHGKSGAGGDPLEEGDVTILSPNGNAEGWGGLQWLYYPEEEYAEALEVVTTAVESCGPVIVNGFSNGAAFAAKMYCRGETLGGRLIGVVIDDPVPDEGVLDCEPVEGVAVTLYWTGALEATATPGWDCAEGDWTCEGGVTIGIDAYADALGVTPTASPFTDHQWYVDAPETQAW